MIGKQKDFQICRSSYQIPLIAFGVSRALSDFLCSLLSRMKLMTWKETELLRELKAKWYSFTLRSLHIACMFSAKENDRLVFYCLTIEIELMQTAVCSK